MQQIDAVMRLKRIGREDSITNQKLKAAAEVIADMIVRCIDPEKLKQFHSNKFSLYSIEMDGLYFGSHGVADTRDDAIRFADDIAKGLLQELTPLLKEGCPHQTWHYMLSKLKQIKDREEASD